MVVAGIQPVQNLAVQQYVSSDPAVRSAWATHWIHKGLLACEAHLRRFAGSYCFGGDLTMADLCLVPQVYNALRFAVPMHELPTVQRIYERCLADAICYQASPFAQPEAADAPR